MTKFTSLLLFVIMFVANLSASDIFVEAESFENKGGWVVDQQFMDLMGSSYLMAHGMGVPVQDASKKMSFSCKGKYYVYVRTYNWTSPWCNDKGPGKFTIQIGKTKLNTVLGCDGNKWMWQLAGCVNINKQDVIVTLHDMTGFNGRCDALFFTTDKDNVPPSEMLSLNDFRKKLCTSSYSKKNEDTYDFVVIGGGIAGMSAAMSAARLGCKVALINDRPVLGGNNSSEIRVHLGGRNNIGLYPKLGSLQNEFGPIRMGNAQPAEFYEDEKKINWLAQEKNITLYPSYRAVAVKKEGNIIKSVIVKNIESGNEISFTAPIFSDCTGDGTIGFLAGADFRMGREGKAEFGESTAPEKADSMTMGASVQWYSIDDSHRTIFPKFEYGLSFTDKSCEKVTMGEWTWETGMNLNQITDFERIRDYGLLVVYSNWSYLKNRLKDNLEYKNKKLGWVAYLSGKRESRRLLGDYILKEDDMRRYVVQEDATASTSWSIDLHYPEPDNSKFFKNMEFKSIAKHINIFPYPIPYRCLYSRNVDNLFMAGRNISVTHVALGTVRVMRTTGMMGEVVGMAASICKKHKAFPRDVYRNYLNELKDLMTKGVGKDGFPNNQKYNIGSCLESKPEICN